MKSATSHVENSDDCEDAGIPPLWKHQEIAIERARDRPYFGLFFEVGTGKSRTLIHILEDKFTMQGRVLRTLIFAPLIVVENLKREFKQFGHLSKSKILTLSGSMEKRLKSFNQISSTGYVVITNYEALYNKPLVAQFLKWKPEVFVADELHKLRDPTSKRARAATGISDICTYKFGLSGTPILNSQLDLFSQIRILDGGATFGKNFFVFRNAYFHDANIGRRGTHSYFPNWIPNPGINKLLQDKIAPFTARVRKEEALDLPPLLKKQHYVEMGKSQAIAYEGMKKDFITFLGSEACTAELAMTKALRLSQICSGFLKLENKSEVAFDDLPRLAALDKIVEDTVPKKLIIWCVFKKNYEMIRTLIKEPICELFGDTSDKQSQIDSFQLDSGPRIMVANPQAGGIGINLTAASYMVYYSRNFSLEQDIQSEARNYRGGSERHESITRIDLITKGTIDELIMEALQKKKNLGADILDNKAIMSILRRV